MKALPTTKEEAEARLLEVYLYIPLDDLHPAEMLVLSYSLTMLGYARYSDYSKIAQTKIPQ